MKHFVEARKDALAALAAAEIAEFAEKVCLIVDLRGKLRVLVKPSAGGDIQAVRTRVEELVAPAADVFWEKGVWVHEAGASPANKAIFEVAWEQAKPQPGAQAKIFVLDRRLSKDAWFGAPFDPPWPLNERTPPILSFYSFKGGVGRTTALLALAINMARAGKRVAVVDFDLEAPGTSSILISPSGVRANLGVVDYLLEHPVVPRDALDITEFYHQYDDPSVIQDGEPVFSVASGVLDEWYLEKLARLNFESLYRTTVEENAEDSSLFSLFKTLRAKLEPDIFLVDSRAGLHDLGGLSLSGLAHMQVLFGLRSRQSWNGLSIVISHLGKEMVLSGLAQRTCMMVQSMVSPLGSVREEEIRSFREQSFEMFSDNYYDLPDLPGAEWPLPDPQSVDSPHFPSVLTWDNKVAGYLSLADIADTLCEGEYRALASAILERVGRVL